MNLQIAKLNEAERATLRLILQGYDAKAIAREQGLSIHTVNERLRQARRKLAVPSSREAARLLSQAENTEHKSNVHKQLGVACLANGSSGGSWHSSVIAVIAAQPVLVTGGFVVTILLVAALMLKPSAIGAAASGDEQSVSHRTNVIEAAPQQSAVAWLKVIDASDYAASWDKAGRQFRAQITPVQWIDALRMVRVPLGRLKSRRAMEMTSASSLPGAPDGEYRILRFETVFERKAVATETVVVCMEDGQWEVEAYLIQ